MFFLVKVGECDYIGLEMATYSEFVKKNWVYSKDFGVYVVWGFLL